MPPPYLPLPPNPSPVPTTPEERPLPAAVVARVLNVKQAIRAAVEAEREACAREADRVAARARATGQPFHLDQVRAAAEIAAAIRARGTAPALPDTPESGKADRAWAVVEELAARGVWLTLEDWRGNANAVSAGWCALFTLPDGHDTGQAIAPTVSQAILLAAARVRGTA